LNVGAPVRAGCAADEGIYSGARGFSTFLGAILEGMNSAVKGFKMLFGGMSKTTVGVAVRKDCPYVRVRAEG